MKGLTFATMRKNKRLGIKFFCKRERRKSCKIWKCNLSQWIRVWSKKIFDQKMILRYKLWYIYI